jgi:hypothetical protein
MQVSINTQELIASLKKYEEEVKRKLEGMVTKFAYESTVIAVNNTPLGNATSSEDGEEVIKDWYLTREMVTGLRAEEGLARGGWQISLDGTLSFRETYGQESGTNASEDAREQMSDYKIGDTVYIGNLGPYIQRLQDNYSAQTKKQGIMQPTENNMIAIYNTDIKQMFDNS